MFLLEILILVPQPIPWYDKFIAGETFSYRDDDGNKKTTVIVYYLSDILFSVMFIRLYLLFRTWASYSSYTDAFSKGICRKYGFTSSVRFAIKCNFMLYPELSFFVIFTTSVMLLAYETRIYELPYIREPNGDVAGSGSFWASIYLVCMTIFTVGYGDVVPHTAVGKILAIVSALWGTFLISISVIAMSHIFELNSNQMKAHKHIMHTHSAAKTISKSCKYMLLKKKYYIAKLHRDPSLIERSPFLIAILSQKEQREKFKDYFLRPTLYTIIKRVQKQFEKMDSQHSIKLEPSNEEKTLLAEMGIKYFEMIQQLRMFQFDNEDFKKTIEIHERELKVTNRLIKKEVIDTADLVEQVSKVLIALNEKIDNNDAFYRNNILEILKILGASPESVNVKASYASRQISVNPIGIEEVGEQDRKPYFFHSTGDVHQQINNSNLSDPNSPTDEPFNIRKSPFYQKRIEKMRVVQETPIHHAMQELGRHLSMKSSALKISGRNTLIKRPSRNELNRLSEEDHVISRATSNESVRMIESSSLHGFPTITIDK